MTRFLLLIAILHTVVMAQSFNYPKRFDAVFTKLETAGVSKARIKQIFSHPKAHKRVRKAVKYISNVKNIKKNRLKERKANKQFLLKSALLQKHLKRYAHVYDAAEAKYGVNREIIAAILQKETALGAFKAYKYDAFEVLCSMLDTLPVYRGDSVRLQKRSARLIEFASNNLFHLVLFYEKQGLDVTHINIKSSYAGAIGIPQFTPQHFDMIDAQDGNHSLHYMPTAIFSTANLLKNRFGFDTLVEYDKLAHFEEFKEQWYAFDDGTANFVYEKNLDGMVVKNFVKSHPNRPCLEYLGEIVKVLKRYNFSTEYALGIIELAIKVNDDA